MLVVDWLQQDDLLSTLKGVCSGWLGLPAEQVRLFDITVGVGVLMPERLYGDKPLREYGFTNERMPDVTWFDIALIASNHEGFWEPLELDLYYTNVKR